MRTSQSDAAVDLLAKTESLLKPATVLSAVPRRPPRLRPRSAATADMGYSSARSVLTCVRSLPALTRLRIRRLCSKLYPAFAWRRRILRPIAIVSLTYVLTIFVSGFYLVIPFTLLPQFNDRARTPLTAIPSLLFFLFIVSNMVVTFILTIITEPGRVPATWKSPGFQMEYPSKPNIPVPVPPSAAEVGPASTPMDTYPDPRSRQFAHAPIDAVSSPSSLAVPPPYSAMASTSSSSATNNSSAVSIDIETLATSHLPTAATGVPTTSPQDQRTRRRTRVGDINVTDTETNTDRASGSTNLHRSTAITISTVSNNDDVARTDGSRRETYQVLDDEEQPEVPQEYPIPPNDLWAAGTMVRRPSDGRFRYCDICEKFKPDRAHHCSACGVCVLHMDHHCPFMANACVGLHNRKFFVLFLFYASFSACSVTFISWRAVFQYMFIEYPTSNNHPWLQSIEQTYPVTAPVLLRFLVGMSYIMITVHALALTPFTAFHFKLVLQNRTTLDDLDKEMNPTLSDLLESSDRDFRTHWNMIFGKVPWAWFVPISYGRDTDMDGMRWLPAYLASGRSEHIHARAHGTKDELESINVQPVSSGIDRGDGLH